LVEWIVYCVITAAAAEVCFYDAVENIEDLPSLCDDNDVRRQSLDPQVIRLQSKVVAICRRRASVRNRKVPLQLFLL